MSGKALNKQEMDSIDLAKFVFAFAVIHIITSRNQLR